MKYKIWGLVSALSATAFVGMAHASLIGDSINIEATHTYAGNCDAVYSATNVVVGAGTELTIADYVSGSCNGGVEINVNANSFTLQGFDEPNGFANYTDSVISLSDLDWIGTPGTIVNVTMTSAIESLFNMVGEGFATVLPTIDITWGANSIDITLTGNDFEFRNNGVGVFEITAVHGVSAPASIVLFGLGLGLVGLGWSRKAKV